VLIVSREPKHLTQYLCLAIDAAVRRAFALSMCDITADSSALRDLDRFHSTEE